MGAREAGGPYPQGARDVGSRICLVTLSPVVTIALFRCCLDELCVICVLVSSSWSGRKTAHEIGCSPQNQTKLDRTGPDQTGLNCL